MSLTTDHVEMRTRIRRKKEANVVAATLTSLARPRTELLDFFLAKCTSRSKGLLNCAPKFPTKGFISAPFLLQRSLSCHKLARAEELRRCSGHI